MADSSAPTPILSADDFRKHLIIARNPNIPLGHRQASSELLAQHDQALRDAVAVLTEERDEQRRLTETLMAYHDACVDNERAKVAVLEAVLRGAVIHLRMTDDPDDNLLAGRIDALLGGVSAAAPLAEMTWLDGSPIIDDGGVPATKEERT